jgi:hypothetical protein
MKAITTLAGVSLPLLLAGCGTTPRFTDLAACEPADALTLRYGEGELAVDKGCIEANRGYTLTFTLMPTGAPRRVKTKYRGLANGWLDRKNDSGVGQIELVIPEDENRGPYKYDVIVRGVGKLDPRIVVP